MFFLPADSSLGVPHFERYRQMAPTATAVKATRTNGTAAELALLLYLRTRKRSTAAVLAAMNVLRSGFPLSFARTGGNSAVASWISRSVVPPCIASTNLPQCAVASATIGPFIFPTYRSAAQ